MVLRRDVLTAVDLQGHGVTDYSCSSTDLVDSLIRVCSGNMPARQDKAGTSAAGRGGDWVDRR